MKISMKIVCVVIAIMSFSIQGCTNPIEEPELNNPRDPYSSNYQTAGPFMEQPLVWGEYVRISWRRQDYYSQENRIERKVHQDSAFVAISTVAGTAVSGFDYGPFTSGMTVYYRVISRSVGGVSHTSNVVSILYP